MKKKPKAKNLVMDAILIGTVLIVVVILISIFINRKAKAPAPEDSAAPAATEAPEASGESEGKEDAASDGEKKESSDEKKTGDSASNKPGKGVKRYSCLVTEGEEAGGRIFFCIDFKDDGTYESFMLSDEKSQQIEQGTYKERKGKLMTKPESTGTALTYIRDDDYLVIESALYKGKVPKGKSFSAKCVCDTEGVGRVAIQFKKDGTYIQELSRYDIGNDDAVERTRGTYRRKGKLIERTLVRKGASGGKEEHELIPLYIYKNQLCSGYYELEK